MNQDARATPSTAQISEAGEVCLDSLIAACAREDSRAFDELYALTVRNLYALAKRMLAHHEDAEEAVQESYLKIWSRAAQFDTRRGTAMTWMFNIVRHQVLDLLRRSQHRITQAEPLVDEPCGASRDLAAELNTQRVVTQVLDAASRRSGAKRSCLELMYRQGYSPSEAALALGLPVATAKTWATRSLARARLRFRVDA